MDKFEKFVNQCSALESRMLKTMSDIDKMKKEIWFSLGMIKTAQDTLDHLEKGAATKNHSKVRS